MSKLNNILYIQQDILTAIQYGVTVTYTVQYITVNNTCNCYQLQYILNKMSLLDF